MLNTQHTTHNISQVVTNISNTECPATSFKTNFQHDHSYALESPSKMKAKIEKLVLKLNNKKATLHNIKRREKTRNNKISKLWRELKSKHKLSSESEALLSSYKTLPIHLFKHKVGTPFTNEQKHFAITMHFYSPSAYEYLKTQLTSLPSPRTIRNWLSSFDGKPGLTQQSYDTIATQLAGAQSWSYKLCCLHMDEMEIKKQMDYDKRSGKVYGFTDIGHGPIDGDSSPQATKVLMILAVGLCGSWKLPVAYYLTNGTNSDLQVSLLKSVISRLWEVGCLVVSITFDGLHANQKTLEKLGGSLKPENLRASFPHPECSQYTIGAIFDACHMMKLARNMLCEHQEINIPRVGKAKWQHIEQLYKQQTKEGLHLANKLTKCHINYKTQKMKVKLALQVFSLSDAKALEFMRISGFPEFQDSQATEKLCLMLNKLFDLLNIRSIFTKKCKATISTETAEAAITFLQECRAFLLQLEDSNGTKLCYTRKRTFVIGFCITIDTTIQLIKNFIIGEGCYGVHMKYLLTYKMSQDHIEIMFGTIRRRGGWNNNPTAQQFQYTFRAILSHVGVVTSHTSNVLADHTNDILSSDQVESILQPPELYNNFNVAELPKLSYYVANICSYIAGYVIHILMPKLKCSDCQELLVTDDVSDSNYSFLKIKNNGGLVAPSKEVIIIVKLAEQNIRQLLPSSKGLQNLSRIGKQLEHLVFQNINFKNLFAYSDHFFDSTDGIDNHVFSLVRQIIRCYVDLRKDHLVKNWNIEQRGVIIRQSMNKTILFKNQ